MNLNSIEIKSKLVLFISKFISYHFVILEFPFFPNLLITSLKKHYLSIVFPTQILLQFNLTMIRFQNIFFRQFCTSKHHPLRILFHNNQQQLKPFQQDLSQSNFNLLSFKTKTHHLQNFVFDFFRDKFFKEQFGVLMKYIQLSSHHKIEKHDEVYSVIDPSLRKKIDQNINEKKLKITLDKCNVIETQLIDEQKIYGVLIHRKFNLPEYNYKFQDLQDRQIFCRLKQEIDKKQQEIYSKLQKTFQQQKLDQLYGAPLQPFQRCSFIYRSLYSIFVELQFTVQREGKIEKYGFDGQTKHILQVESFENNVTDKQHCFVTDIDFFLKGNDHLTDIN